MILLYNLLLLLVILLALPLLIKSYFTTPKYRGTVLQRLGILPRESKQRLSAHLSEGATGTGCFWVHAVSVGETLAARPLVEQLHARYPHLRVVFSTVTKTGQQVARDKITCIDTLLYLPADLTPIIDPLVGRVAPQFMVVMETELWPGLFHALGRRAIPLMVINGRLSPGSFGNYHKVRWLMRRILKPVTLFAMQSKADAQRMAALCPDAERIKTTGNIKYDQALAMPSAGEIEALQARIPPPVGPVWIAASTHSGEEEIIIDTFWRLRGKHAGLRLILVPRHPERCREVTLLIKKPASRQGHSGDEADQNAIPEPTPLYRRLSATDGQWPEPILLVDEVGWLRRLYSYARVAFMGGSLIPHGGQNMLESAAWRCPPLFGPHTFNFKAVVNALTAADAARPIEDAEGLYQAVDDLLNDDTLRREMGRRARRVVEQNAGSLARTLDAIAEVVPPPGAADAHPDGHPSASACTEPGNDACDTPSKGTRHG